MTLRKDASFAFFLKLLVKCAFNKVWENQNELEISLIHQIMVNGNFTNIMGDRIGGTYRMISIDRLLLQIWSERNTYYIWRKKNRFERS
jgi:hypothetical protein